MNFDSAKIAGLDVDSEALEEEVPFTFEDFDVPEQLKSTFYIYPDSVATGSLLFFSFLLPEIHVSIWYG